MDAAEVASFYRRKGYTVRDGVKATGASGNEHKVPLLAEGPLGSLAIFFGDFGGVDGPEMGGARKVARDLGATPVLAADEFSNQDRQTAARLGVVLIDRDAVAVEPAPGAAGPLAGTGIASIPSADPARAWPGLAPTRKRDEPEPHPWPASGRVGGRDGPRPHAIDVDDILAAPRPREAPAPEPQAAPDVSPASAPETPDEAPAPEGESLWSRPRAQTAAAAKPPREAGSKPFAWLGGEAPAAGSAPQTLEYADTVAAREASAPDAEGDDDSAPDERILLAPPAEVADRLRRRARLERRLFWILFGVVLLTLFYLFWTGHF